MLSTNQDTLFERVFPPEKISAIQEDWRYFQCRRRCHDELYYNEVQVETLYNSIEDTAIPSELVPKCPQCGAPMIINMAQDRAFFTMPHWKGKQRAFEDFLTRHRDDDVALLVLGVGQRNQLVTGALMQARDVLSDTSTIIVNKGGGTGKRPDGTIAIDDDITAALVAIERNVKR